MFVPEMATDKILDRVSDGEGERLSRIVRASHAEETGVTTVWRFAHGLSRGVLAPVRLLHAALH